MEPIKDKKPMYPIFLELEGERCLVVGGGHVAERKIERLLESGARVTVIAPEVTGRIAALAEEGAITLDERRYAGGEAAEYFLVIAATDDTALNRVVSSDARLKDKIVNIVDVPELCNFYVPSVLRRGDLQIAVSTAGASPSVAKKIREKLEPLFPETYAQLLRRLREFRAQLMEKESEETRRMEIYGQVAGSPEIEKFLEGDPAPLEALIKRCV
ncbi:MAG: bifunctional precorrin-2 dehydrogenase/sirohydrochlorin ferrochelatase [bacterium]